MYPPSWSSIYYRTTRISLNCISVSHIHQQQEKGTNILEGAHMIRVIMWLEQHNVSMKVAFRGPCSIILSQGLNLWDVKIHETSLYVFTGLCVIETSSIIVILFPKVIFSMKWQADRINILIWCRLWEPVSLVWIYLFKKIWILLNCK